VFQVIVGSAGDYMQVWAGAGPLWLLVNSSPLNERLVENFLVWIPVALLMLSLGLATASGDRRSSPRRLCF
jgi:hypothetical protein